MSNSSFNSGGTAGPRRVPQETTQVPIRIAGTVDTTPTDPGQKAAVASMSVVLASDQPAVPVSISGTIPISGGLTDTQLRASPLSVNFTNANIGISGSVAVTGPLTDTQLRATALAVSGPLTDTQLRASAISVTFSNSTIGISGSVAVTGPLTDTQLRASAVPVSGTVGVSGTVTVTGGLTDTQLRASAVPMSLATLPALVAGTALIGKVGVDQTTPGTTNGISVAFVGATAVATGNGVVGAGVQRVAIASDNSPLAVTPPTLTKGVQSATGNSVQALKDAGRNSLAMTAEFTFAQVAETLLTMTLSANGGATSTFSSRVITSGKKFRIQTAIIQIELLGSSTTPQRAYLRMRANTAGATVAGSPLQWILPVGVTTAIVKASNWASLDMPDGFELNGDGTATFGFTLETPDWVTTTATGRAKITIIGFEY